MPFIQLLLFGIIIQIGQFFQRLSRKIRYDNIRYEMLF